jgi:hypothetical protein
MNRRQVDRFRESRERREEALAELERRLLEELWDTPSQVLDRPSRVHPPPVETEAPPSAPRGLSPQAKQAITVVAMAIGTAIVSALSSMGTTK